MPDKLLVSVRRPLGAWSRFRPWSNFVQAFLSMSEEHRRVQITDDARVQVVRLTGEPATNLEVRQALDQLDVELFEALETKLDFQEYVRKNPFGKFATVAKRKVDEIDGRQSIDHQYRATSPANFTWDCFISHSTPDKDRIRELKARLTHTGLRVWIDEEQIKPGDRITEKIDQGLTGSRRIVICLSQAFLLSRWCRAEYGPFLNDEITRDVGARVIPLELEPVNTSEIPRLLQDKLRVKYFEKDGWERLVECLRDP